MEGKICHTIKIISPKTEREDLILSTKKLSLCEALNFEGDGEK